MNLLFCLHNKDVGTGDVEIGCRKLCARMKGKTRGFVRTITTWKTRDGKRCKRQAQYDNTKVPRKSRVLLKREGDLSAYEQLWRKEKAHCISVLSEARRGKVELLVRKYSHKKVLPSTLRGVTIEEQDVSASFTT